MTDPLDDPLAELSAVLDVDPSPEFAARVRTRIAAVRGRETLIAPDQAIAFERLVRLVYEGRIVAPTSDWPKTSALDPVEPPAEVTVPPVEVKPVVINPLVIDTLSDQEG